MVSKKDCGVRPILSLKLCHKFLLKQRFKMESLQGILLYLLERLFVASLDRKDAYFHVPMHRDSWTFLRFSITGRQFQSHLPLFSLSLGPVVFTRVVQCIVAWLRERGVRLHAYLDDLLIIGQSSPSLECFGVVGPQQCKKA